MMDHKETKMGHRRLQSPDARKTASIEQPNHEEVLKKCAQRPLKIFESETEPKKVANAMDFVKKQNPPFHSSLRPIKRR
jgi:hypothetical protein